MNDNKLISDSQSEVLRGGYGEGMGSYEGTTWGSACGRERGAVPLKTAESQNLHHKCLKRRDLSPIFMDRPQTAPGMQKAES